MPQADYDRSDIASIERSLTEGFRQIITFRRRRRIRIAATIAAIAGSFAAGALAAVFWLACG
jgi:uncharacterized protein (DUF2062 family)